LLQYSFADLYIAVPYAWRGMVMYMINLHPLLSLQVHCYPECLEEVRPRYKTAAAERQMWSCQWELFHCSIVFTVPVPSVNNRSRTVVQQWLHIRLLAAVLL